MFTGIIEQTAQIVSINETNQNRTFTLECQLAPELKVDQSVAHNGVCLTVEQVEPAQNRYTLTAIHETLIRTNLGEWQLGQRVNVERCLRADQRLDGHFVQGHVDDTGSVLSIQDEGGSWRVRIGFEARHAALVVHKGSICIDGVSLTVANCGNDWLEVALIPYTWTHTNLHQRQVGDRVNLEFDILGKYLLRYLATREQA